ncbi:MAG: tRNA glutamyl-Q(34) synthetase GluQRS [Gammaproteobacteria bacterium]|nr:tRNA glutamyl-Q(34) synthetase GluQRS [Rhodocyclaceae bacterium]MBU3908177.1 tRNA glutamyl-Q(34) synthetase GluQRS [Gammaproteobacteria bacterium]MBU3989121.1 tRNA glutamyl-Q(34) synthetase GluQRS [Gammaproteobacteria bacterium]MBU4005998.1 tRNA glutamyl-Q(34) synthetase GluQRS [Gammaproteobacteria bacterium]MBU4019996.1 tRNA glutamyl-Q(34) synthetase GluQRS [Gammaproteobacteria bacterium]
MIAPTLAGACGRFAPSPTGPLHFGSLVAALGSCLEARSRGGRWLLRMEDVDQPRSRTGAAASILATLEACGFEWDGEVMVQSTRSARYREVFEQLLVAGEVYSCGCTRSEIDDAPNITSGIDGAPVYPGTCRNGLPPGKVARAWRLRVADTIEFVDALQGKQRQNLPRDVGDCVLLRADGLFAYQLAVVVDDADQGVDHVVRGADLIDSTPRQIYLQRLLGLPTPAYAHLPVAVDAAGNKLSKQTRAAPVDATHPVPALFAALSFLGQQPPAELRRTHGGGALAERRRASADLWAWALAHWNLEKVPHVLTQPALDYLLEP